MKKQIINLIKNKHIPIQLEREVIKAIKKADLPDYVWEDIYEDTLRPINQTDIQRLLSILEGGVL